MTEERTATTLANPRLKAAARAYRVRAQKTALEAVYRAARKAAKGKAG